MHWKLGAVLLLIVELAHDVHGLRCYVCNSAFQKDCGNGQPSKEYIVECSPDTAQPLAITQHGKLTAKPSTSISTSSESSGSPSMIAPVPNLSKNKRLENVLALESEAHLAASMPGVNYTFCRKTITSIPRQHNRDNIKEADKRIVRSCGWIEDQKSNFCKWSDSGEVQNEYCVCSGKDECNNGAQLTVSIVSLGLMAAIAHTLH